MVLRRCFKICLLMDVTKLLIIPLFNDSLQPPYNRVANAEPYTYTKIFAKPLMHAMDDIRTNLNIPRSKNTPFIHTHALSPHLNFAFQLCLIMSI